VPGQYSIPTQDDEFFDLDLPSGGTVQVRRLTIEDLVALDILDQMDVMGALVQEEHIDRVKGTGKPSDRPKKKPTKAEKAAAEDANGIKMMKDLMGDQKKWGALSVTMDRVFVAAVSQPKVALAYDQVTVTAEGSEPEAKWIKHDATARQSRDKSFVWTDQVDISDKMHVFGSVLPGQEKMANFREGSAEAVGDMADGGKAGAESS
jgi:hypothetical protein